MMYEFMDSGRSDSVPDRHEKIIEARASAGSRRSSLRATIPEMDNPYNTASGVDCVSDLKVTSKSNYCWQLCKELYGI